MSNTSPRRTSRPTTTTQQRGRAVPPRRSALRVWLPIGLGLLALIVFGVTLATSGGVGPVGEIEGVTTFNNVTSGHADGDLTYEQTPPVGGTHNSAWQNCGIYANPVRNEHAVHSLEHGAVWITYRPDLAPDAVEQLKELARSRSYTLLSPYPDLPSPVAASAWGVQLTVDGADDPRLAQFISKYAQGPQTPEPGASCTGGISTSIRS